MVSEKLVKFVVETGFDRIPSGAVTAVKNAMLDTLGVTLAGSTEPSGKIITSFVKKLGGEPVAGVIGSKLRTSAPNAALANGTMAHALDYDDTGGVDTQGHLSVPLFSTVFPLGEGLGSSGKEIIEAYVLGAEVWSRIARAMPMLHDKGWHPTAVFGTMGAAIAAAKLLRLDVEQTMMALGLAGSEAAGLGQNFGTMTKPFQVGNAARSGIVAAMLAKEGFTATKNVLEGRLGFPVAFYGQQEVDVSKMAENLGDTFTVVSPGINVKKFPSCYGTHSSIDAMLHLIEKYDIQPEEVQAVDCRVHPLAMKLLFYTDPCKALEGRFSMQFVMAVALTDRKVGLAQVTDEKVNNPLIKKLMKKVTIGPHPDWVEGESIETRPHVVTVRLKNGKEYTHGVAKAKGHADVPLSWDELLVKYRECAKLVLNDKNVERSIELLANLEKLKGIRELIDIVTGGG